MNLSFLRMFSAFILSVILAGCAGQLKQLPDGSYLGVTTAGDTLDRSASFIGLYEVKRGTDGKPILGADGKPVLVLKEKGQLSVGPTVGGQVIVGATAGSAAAYIQGEALKDATKLGKCSEGANCGNVFNVQGGEATAVSGSSSQSANHNAIKVNTNVSTGVSAPIPCKTSGCTGR